MDSEAADQDKSQLKLTAVYFYKLCIFGARFYAQSDSKSIWRNWGENLNPKSTEVVTLCWTSKLFSIISNQQLCDLYFQATGYSNSTVALHALKIFFYSFLFFKTKIRMIVMTYRKEAPLGITVSAFGATNIYHGCNKRLDVNVWKHSISALVSLSS